MEKSMAGAALVLVLVALILLFMSLEPDEVKLPEVQEEEEAGDEMEAWVSPIEPRDAEIEEQVERILQSMKWGDERATPLPAELFAQLPEFPPDLYRVALLYRYDHITYEELVSLPEEYWKQPEWYASFDQVGIEMMKDAQLGSAGLYGYGVYKADEYRTAYAGDELKDVFFFHTSWRVKSYQGMMLVANYNQSALEVSIEPSIFLLGPTHPEFHANWTEKIVVNVRVKPDAAPGEYVIGIEAEQPPEEYEEMWKDPHTYVEPTFKMGMGRPLHQLHITIGDEV
ncbi:hypothetical protein DRN67_00820 [Candidatus Micrarchaeota archaeon]|nr:MAG: hypothetical protein DRN67_00820 [Candidatus Micrarchaeota archaeon]